ncbi:MAG: CCA tRNA nucleotidyltransferase [Parvularculales bacterium]
MPGGGSKEEYDTRFVGGCVRDSLLGLPVKDVDIATRLKPELVVERLRKAGLSPRTQGIGHGTAGVTVSGISFEITTLRVDVKTDGRHAEVAYTDDWVVDASRRDFTLNALYADRYGVVYDPLGGRSDLKAGVVRFIGEAETRIREDYLRILRFFRFHARYGAGELNGAGFEACQALKQGLEKLSAGRVREELLKILGASGGPMVLRTMAATGILSIVLPEATYLGRYERLVDIEEHQLFKSDAVLRLAALLDPDVENVEAVAGRLKLSRADRDRLKSCLLEGIRGQDANFVCYLSMREVRRRLYVMGERCFQDRVMLGWASDEKSSNSVQWRALLAMADSWKRPRFPLTGDMVRKAGVPEGSEMGRVMDEVEEWWIEADFTDDMFSIIERLKAVVQATVY